MPTINLQVAAAGDDGYQIDGSTLDTTATAATVGTGTVGTSPKRAYAARFTNVTIPQGATINSATLTLRQASTSFNNVLGTWRANAVDSAAALSTGEDVTARALTTANVACAENISRTGGTFYSFPTGADFSAVIQEIVSRSGWASGNALLMIFVGDGASSFASTPVDSFDNASAGAAKLDITYTAASTTNSRDRAVLRGVMRGI